MEKFPVIEMSTWTMLVRQYEEAKVKSFKEYFVVVHEMPPYESSY